MLISTRCTSNTQLQLTRRQLENSNCVVVQSTHREGLLACDKARNRAQRSEIVCADLAIRHVNAEFLFDEGDHRGHVLRLERGFLEEPVVSVEHITVLPVQRVPLREASNAREDTRF